MRVDAAGVAASVRASVERGRAGGHAGFGFNGSVRFSAPNEKDPAVAGSFRLDGVAA
jgi:hypothetical protein